MQGSEKSHQFWLSLDTLFVQRLSAALHADSVVGPCAHLHRMVINDVPFRCLVNANPQLALPFKWQIYDIKRELIWLLQLIYGSSFRSNITPKIIICESRRLIFGYLELSRNLVGLVILGWIKTRNKMLVCQVLALMVLWFRKTRAKTERMYLVEKAWEHSRKMHSFINGCFFIHRYIHKHFLEAIDAFCFCCCPKCLLKRFDILPFFNWLIYPNLKSRPSIVKSIIKIWIVLQKEWK